jgi:hypothetical protein
MRAITRDHTIAAGPVEAERVRRGCARAFDQQAAQCRASARASTNARFTA